MKSTLLFKQALRLINTIIAKYLMRNVLVLLAAVFIDIGVRKNKKDSKEEKPKT